MEIDVTHMVEDADNMIELSGSRAEHGQDASRITWNNSKAYGADRPLLTTDDMRDAARAHFKEYGAWSEEEIAATVIAQSPDYYTVCYDGEYGQYVVPTWCFDIVD